MTDGSRGLTAKAPLFGISGRGKALRVYLDAVFALNGAINFLLLSAAAWLMGVPGGWGRRALGGAFGGLYACACCLPGLAFLSSGIWRGVFLVLMLVISFGLRRQTASVGAVFLALSMALGGLALLLASAAGEAVWLREGRACYALRFRTLVLGAGTVYALARLGLGGLMVHSGGTVAARLELRGKATRLILLRDTGNTLRDPFSGAAVPVVERGAMARVLPELERLRLDDAAGAMERLCAQVPGISARLIPFRAVGTECALLLAVRCDALVVAGDRVRDVYVAISPTRVSEHGNYEGLIGGNRA